MSMSLTWYSTFEDTMRGGEMFPIGVCNIKLKSQTDIAFQHTAV